MTTQDWEAFVARLDEKIDSLIRRMDKLEPFCIETTRNSEQIAVLRWLTGLIIAGLLAIAFKVIGG